MFAQRQLVASRQGRRSKQVQGGAEGRPAEQRRPRPVGAGAARGAGRRRRCDQHAKDESPLVRGARHAQSCRSATKLERRPARRWSQTYLKDDDAARPAGRRRRPGPAPAPGQRRAAAGAAAQDAGRTTRTSSTPSASPCGISCAWPTAGRGPTSGARRTAGPSPTSPWACRRRSRRRYLVKHLGQRESTRAAARRTSPATSPATATGRRRRRWSTWAKEAHENKPADAGARAAGHRPGVAAARRGAAGRGARRGRTS